jgi:ATP-dependent Clp protease adaptor protein ClpS
MSVMEQQEEQPAAAVAEPPEAAPEAEKKAADARPAEKPGQKCDKLPPWNLVLHNDDHNEMMYVVETIVRCTPLTAPVAVRRMVEAHTRGKTTLLTTHRELAELYRERLESAKLTATLEAGS